MKHGASLHLGKFSPDSPPSACLSHTDFAVSALYRACLRSAPSVLTRLRLELRVVADS